MQIVNGTIFIRDTKSISPGCYDTSFTDNDGTMVNINNLLLFRLVDVIKADFEKRGLAFEDLILQCIRHADESKIVG